MLLGKLNKQHKSLWKVKDSVERIFMDVREKIVFSNFQDSQQFGLGFDVGYPLRYVSKINIQQHLYIKLQK